MTNRFGRRLQLITDQYGRRNVIWKSNRYSNTLEDIFTDPTRLYGLDAEDMLGVIDNQWIRGVYGSNGKGWKYCNHDRSVFYHAGGGHHNGSYWGAASARGGRCKIVDPETYVPTIDDGATIIEY